MRYIAIGFSRRVSHRLTLARPGHAWSNFVGAWVVLHAGRGMCCSNFFFRRVRNSRSLSGPKPNLAASTENE